MKTYYYKFKVWMSANPKKVYIYSMTLILLSFLFTTLQYIYFPPDFKPKSLVPSLYAKSDAQKIESDLSEKKMQLIIDEMMTLKEKADNGLLSGKDSLRLQYLNLEFQKAKKR